MMTIGAWRILENKGQKRLFQL